jgi:hypothetical protein
MIKYLKSVQKNIISRCLLILLSTLILIICPIKLFAENLSLSDPVGKNVQVSPYKGVEGPSYPVFHETYFTDDYGNILMFVNVLGQINKQGQFVVRENADFSTILAVTGGIRDDVNLRNVLVIRQAPDNNGKQAYVVDLKPFYKKGDRANFITLKPNDTIIFPEKSISLAKISQVLNITYPFISFYMLLNKN